MHPQSSCKRVVYEIMKQKYRENRPIVEHCPSEYFFMIQNYI